MTRTLRVLGLLTFLILTFLTVNANTVTYTFEPPQFTEGEFTPLVNRSPNVGPASFRASFVSAIPGTYTTAGFAGNPFPLFSGDSLGAPFTPNLLTITFNTTVTQVEFAWAQVDFHGRIDFVSAVGNRSQESGNVGGNFEGGNFVFSSATPFTSFSLQAFNTAGAPVLFAIDNLTLTTETDVVPEPTTLLLFGAGLIALGTFRKRSC